MPTVVLSPIGGAGQQFFDNSGNVLAGGKLYTYAAGTTTPLTTYTTSAGSVARTNPVVLDSAGRVSGDGVWIVSGSPYKFVLDTSTGTTLGTWDNISGIGGNTNGLTVIKDASSGAETIATFGISDAVGRASLVNGSTVDGEFLPTWDYTPTGAYVDQAVTHKIDHTFDPSLTNSVYHKFVSRTAAAGSVATYYLTRFFNSSNAVMSLRAATGASSSTAGALIFDNNTNGSTPWMSTDGQVGQGERIVFSPTRGSGGAGGYNAIGEYFSDLWMSLKTTSSKFTLYYPGGIIYEAIVTASVPLMKIYGNLWLTSPAGAPVYLLVGVGTPEASKTAPIGSIYMRTDGGAGTTFYVKESGTGNTGWVGK